MLSRANRKVEKKMKELIMNAEDERRHADQYKEQVRSFTSDVEPEPEAQKKKKKQNEANSWRQNENTGQELQKLKVLTEVAVMWYQVGSDVGANYWMQRRPRLHRTQSTQQQGTLKGEQEFERKTEN